VIFDKIFTFYTNHRRALQERVLKLVTFYFDTNTLSKLKHNDKGFVIHPVYDKISFAEFITIG